MTAKAARPEVVALLADSSPRMPFTRLDGRAFSKAERALIRSATVADQKAAITERERLNAISRAKIAENNRRKAENDAALRWIRRARAAMAAHGYCTLGELPPDVLDELVADPDFDSVTTRPQG